MPQANQLNPCFSDFSLQRLVDYFCETVGKIFFICEPNSFKVLNLTDSARDFFGYKSCGEGVSIEKFLPHDFVDTVKNHFFRNNRQVFHLPLTVSLGAEQVNCYVDVLSLSNQRAGGLWLFGVSQEYSLKVKNLYQAAPPEPNSWTSQMAVEAERARLGVELHDTLGQELAVLQLGLTHIGHNFLEYLDINTPAVADIYKQVNDLMDHVTAIAESTRYISLGLRPSQLDLGLDKACETFLHELYLKFNVKTDFKVSENWLNPNAVVSANFFGALKEMVGNCIKYADADVIEVALFRENGAYVLSVKDDGVGIPLEVLQSFNYKWYSLYYRAVAISGSLEVKTRPEVPGTWLKFFCKAPGY